MIYGFFFNIVARLSFVLSCFMPDRRPSTPFTPEEKAEILAMHEEGISAVRIAKKLDRTQPGVSQFIRRYTSTRDLAKALFDAKAEGLAERVIAKADVDQSLEVLDRMDVLPKRRDEGAQQQFSLIIGSPEPPPAPPPVPTEMEKVIEATSSEYRGPRRMKAKRGPVEDPFIPEPDNF